MEREFFNDIVVVKRSGQRVDFNDMKIALAIKKGFDSVYENYDEKNVNKVKEKVLDNIEKKYQNRKTIGVEDIQDVIEEELKHLKYDEVYESYKGYRERRSASRDAFVTKQQQKTLKEKMLMLMVMDRWGQCYILDLLYQKNLLKHI